MTFSRPIRRDRKRRPTVDERREILLRADGRCQNCGEDLGHDYHNAHLAAWSNGGPTTLENIQAQCMACNLTNGATNLEGADGIRLRLWQADALPVILEQLWQTGSATLNAAPGAGKTLFAVAVYTMLRKAGLANRLIVVSPNLTIKHQWAKSAKKLGVYLDDEPRDGHLEHQETEGAVITYQSLTPKVVELHRQRLDQYPDTMVVFDEVHHIAGIGEKKSWGAAVTRMVGDIANGDVYPAAVLNMTGTLFRSGRDKRITTVRYRPVLDSDGVEKLEAQADWSIGTAELIGEELRSPDLYVYSSRAELLDTHNETIVSGALGDLDKQQRKTALRGLDKSPEWLHGYVSEAYRLLRNQLAAINHEEPLKLLYCAADIKSAKLAADTINSVTGKDFARLVTSDDAKAKAILTRAVEERQPCAIVQVKMATEGFDCPQVATIAYASNVTADLSIAQMMARAMRVTDTERAGGRLLPAQILIPDNPDLRAVFTAIMSDLPRLVDLDDATQCDQCGLPAWPNGCTCPPRDGEGFGSGRSEPRLPRYQLMNLTGPEFQLGHVLGHENGEVEAWELDAAREALNSWGIPSPYHLRAVAFNRNYQAPTPRYSDVDPVMVSDAHPRDMNRVYRAQLSQAAGWMYEHINHDARFSSAAVFQSMANDQAYIPKGGRDQASTIQLAAAVGWMLDRIMEHCIEMGEEVPSWVNRE